MKYPNKRDGIVDVLVIGGGVAGLAAAIGAAYDGRTIALIEKKNRFGGQAGTATLIHNVFGFPEGVTGPELIKRAQQQAARLGVRMEAPAQANCITREGAVFTVTCEDGEEFRAYSILLALGVELIRLSAPGVAAYLGNGISYGSPVLDSPLPEGSKVYIVGGANSAGQAAMWCSQFSGCEVHLLVRGANITDKMSEVLVRSVLDCRSIIIHPETEVAQASGDTVLRRLQLRSPAGITAVDCDRLMVLIGAKPHTHWLEASGVPLDKHRFVLCGHQLPELRWGDGTRKALGFETGVPGIFAAGDIRSGSATRAGAAIGAGTAAVRDINTYLAMATELYGL